MTNTILKASAGSGKTYRLSNVFLNILLASPQGIEALDSILASTFTCKAAGEISERIFKKLADIVLNPEERKYLKDHIDFLKTDPSEEVLQDWLAKLAKNIARMRVGTLDSYFNKVASIFSPELNLPPEWSGIDEKSDEYANLLSEAIHELLEGPDRAQVVELLATIQFGKESVTIVKDLTKLAKDNLKLVTDTAAEVWGHIPESVFREIPEGSTPENLCQQLEELSDDLLPKTNAKKPRAHFLKAKVSIPQFVRENNWDDFFGKGVSQSVIPSLREGITDECKFDTIILQEGCPELFRIVRELALHGSIKQLEKIIAKTRAYYKLLKLLSDQFVSILERERRFRFDDITRRVAHFDFSKQLDSLHHRLNAETKHLLLDEFQDTSLSQWGIVEPVAHRVVNDQEGTFFCVGDLKQAIFAWRGGVAEIFETIKKKLGGSAANINDDTMRETRRNTQPIVDTVNFLFENIASNSIVREVSSAAGDSWQTKRFELHQIAENLDGQQGFCTLEQAPDEFPNELEQNKVGSEDNQDDTNDNDENVASDADIEYAAKRIAELNEILKERPDLKDGMGVLVWTNKTIEKIVEKLKDKYGIEVNGKGRSLETSLAVRYVLSALKLADHPGDTISLFHLAHGPLAEILVEKKEEIKNRRKDWCYWASSTSRKIRRELLSKGYGEVIKEYITHLTPSCDAQERQCLAKLLELAYCFDEGATGIRTSQFISIVKEASLSNPNAARIHVMTLFGAKGLEFDIVVLPELGGGLEGKQPNNIQRFILGHETPDDVTSPISFVLAQPNEKVFEILPQIYHDAKKQQVQAKVEESLSQLYVAMTRTKRQLVMIKPGKPKPRVNSKSESKPKSKPESKPKTSFAETLRTGLIGKGDPVPQEGNILYQCGNLDWFKEEETTKKKEESPKESCKAKVALASKQFLHHVPRKTPSTSHREAPSQENSKEAKKPSKRKLSEVTPFLETGEKLKRNEKTAPIFGTCIHSCFENAVLWLDETSKGGPELLCSDQELSDILDEYCQGPKLGFTPRDVIANFHANRKSPEIIAVLSKTRYPGHQVEVERERLFAVWNNEHILRGCVDRLVIERDKSGKIIGMEILDYKSNTGDVVIETENYRDQMKDYQTAMATLFQVETSIIKRTLVFVTQGKVIEL